METINKEGLLHTLTRIDELYAKRAEIPDTSDFVTKNDVLTKTNTTAFTPTGNYQPATKKYVDDSVSGKATTTYVDNAIASAIGNALGGSY